MTTHKNRKSLFAASGAALLAVSLVAGCSSGGDVEAFCTDGGAVVDGSFLDDSDVESQEDLAAVYETALDRIDEVDPPSDIKDDWEMTTEALHTYLEGLSELDPESETYMDDMQKLTEGMDEDELTEASENVEKYIEENCEA